MTFQEVVTQHQILRERIQAAERIHQHELEKASQSEATIWKDYGLQTTDYALAFPDFLRLIGVDNFANFLIQHKARHHWQSLNALDIAAPIASFIGQQPAIDAGMAITLTDTRSKQQKLADAARHRSLIEGNIFQHQTWNHLHKLMQPMGIRAFEFIVARPYAGLVDRVDEVIHARFCFSLLQRLYRLLSPDNGILITEVPYFPNQEIQLPAYVKRLKEENITAALQTPDENRHYGYRYALMLVRNNQASARLPILK